MTDITELAQRMKAAAEKATPGPWKRSSVRFNGITDITNPMEQGNKPHVASASEKRDAEFIALANPANILALVEALDLKEQQRANWFQIAQKLGEDLDAAEKRIAEVESRTVKLPKLKMLEDYLAEVATEERKQILVGVRLEFHRALTAAGIKWEAE